MFEVPSAKRVKRSQLFHSDDEDVDIHENAGPDTKTLNGRTHDHEEGIDEPPNYGFEYEFISPNLPVTTTIESASNPQEEGNTKPSEPTQEPEIYSFNLFAQTRPQKPTTNSQDPLPTQNHDTDNLSQPQVQPQPHKISIRSPSPQPETTTPGSLPTRRPESHYFTSALPPSTLHSLRSSYLASAIDFSTLQLLSKRPWPGISHPHRLITLPSHRKQIVIHKSSTTLSTATNTTLTPTTPSHHDTSAKTQHRARPSKKRRDLAKLMAQKRQVLIDETKTKEEHEREKRNKKNRERKLKRRAKERKEKEGERGEIGGDGAGNVEGSIGGSEG